MKFWSVINEKKLAEDLIKNKSLINKNTRDYIIAYIKYLKNEKKLSKNSIRNELDQFLITNLKGFVVADWDTKLQRWVNKYSKLSNCNYKEDKNINITKEELDLISSIGDIGNIKSIEIEKMLFIMLVLAKSTYRENKDLWCNYSSKDIFNLARYKYKTKSESSMLQREYLLYDIKQLNKDKYIDFVGENIKILYGSKKEDNIILKLELNENNINNVVLEYLNWRKLDNYDYCTVCGKEIKQDTNKPKKYCKKCANIIKRKNDIDRQKIKN